MPLSTYQNRFESFIIIKENHKLIQN